MRKAVLNFHLIAALGASIVLIILSVTGCLLIFEKTMDAFLDPGMYYVKAEGQLLPFTEILDRLQAAVPAKHVTDINLGRADQSIMGITKDHSRVYVNG